MILEYQRNYKTSETIESRKQECQKLQKLENKNIRNNIKLEDFYKTRETLKQGFQITRETSNKDVRNQKTEMTESIENRKTRISKTVETRNVQFYLRYELTGVILSTLITPPFWKEAPRQTS